MKLNKNLKKLILPAIGGLLLSAYFLYDKNKTFGTSETISLTLTAGVILSIFFILNKKTSKNE